MDRESEGTMHQGTTDELLGDQLLLVARDPELRLKVYEHLRDYCHQCRNRLNSLKLSIYLAIRQAPSTLADHWIEIERHYQDLESRVDQVQLLCRPMVLSRVKLGIDLLIEDRRVAWAGEMARQGNGLEVVPPEDRAVVSFDVDWLGRALDALVAWRASALRGCRSATLRWWAEDGLARVTWEEPATAFPEEDVAARRDGHAWTLPLLARVALAHGGNYRIRTERGWLLELSWPSQHLAP